MAGTGNIFSGAEADPAQERFDTVLTAPGVRIERIVSHGQASPAAFWYDQPQGEWVLVLTGAATLEFEGTPAPISMAPGDYVWIPPHRRHRVAHTAVGVATVWLTVHVGEAEAAGT